ncbi:hypothetical protein GPJ56_004927 [Histomonas meleagridis]|uniref:uncharacterized protein n=1 Tax=Histomonas meleagridis TaxID=135588 RepID=UPI00355A0D47|nr:hypothetical protein GPJ56_004927 [Histomonas meleagridis]KAH0798547.1 hypothetical protein GO595_008412 [Histomonas meleagridis]
MVFDSLIDLITHIYRQEQTSMLSLDRIFEAMQNPNFFLNTKSNGTVPCSTISRRRISSVLSSSDFFVRAGPPRTCLWAIRPNNPLFLSDATISTSIEQMLTTNGPMTLEQFVEFTELNGADIKLFENFLHEHSNEFSQLEDGKYWFTGQKPPVPKNFDNISQALISAFSNFPQGASVEELHWNLCLSTVGGNKPISRRSVSRELSRRTDLFMHLSRARYILMPQAINRRPRSLSTGFKLHPSQDQISFPSPTSPIGSNPSVMQPLDLQSGEFKPKASRPNVFPVPHLQNHVTFQDPLPIPDLMPPKFPTDEDEFDPNSFFDQAFEFSFE